MGGAPMAGIVQKIKIFKEAHKIAWDQLSANDQLTGKQRTDLGRFLSEAIHRLVRSGKTDANLIAAEAMQEISTYRNESDGR